MRSMRTTIAAGVTLLALGGLTAVALSAGSSETATTSVPTTDVRTQTQVVEEVVRRTRRGRGPGSSGAAVSAGAGTTASAPATSSSRGPSSNRGPGSTTSGPSGSNRGSDDHGRNRGSDDHGRGDDDGADHDIDDDHGGDRDRGDDHGGGEDHDSDDD